MWPESSHQNHDTKAWRTLWDRQRRGQSRAWLKSSKHQPIVFLLAGDIYLFLFKIRLLIRAVKKVTFTGHVEKLWHCVPMFRSGQCGVCTSKYISEDSLKVNPIDSCSMFPYEQGQTTFHSLLAAQRRRVSTSAYGQMVSCLPSQLLVPSYLVVSKLLWCWHQRNNFI